MIMIESRQNGTLKHLARLAREKKYRQNQNEMLCEGEKMLYEALSSKIQLKTVLALDGMRDDIGRGLLLQAEQAGAALYTAPAELFRLASNVETPQNIVFSCVPPVFNQNVLKSNSHVVILDGVQDPGNMGTILRTAEAFAIDAVILSNRCTDPFAPKVVRATMGAIFRQPILRLSVAQAVAELHKMEVPTYAAALVHHAVPIDTMPLDRCAIIIGNEGNGVSEEAIALADRAVVIPMQGNAESLNAGIAASIFMWEMVKDKRI